jgi:hypothetical protein
MVAAEDSRLYTEILNEKAAATVPDRRRSPPE